METEETFLPTLILPSLRRMWLLFLVYVVVFGIISFYTGFTVFNAILMGFAIVIGFSILLLTRRVPISVTISRPEAKLYFRYTNCFGQQKQLTVYIPTAKLSYRAWHARYSPDFMSIVIYNNIFTNYMSLSENASGYSRQQLDIIDEHIKTLRTIPV